jgi:peptide/nickel transport system permease protein
MLIFVVRRLAFLGLTLLGMSIVLFVITRLIPADPARIAAGEYATREMIQAARVELGLDRSPPEQYLMYLRAVSRGDLGRSVQSRRPVLDDLMTHFPATLELSLFSLVFSTLVAIPLGIVAATRRNGSVDHVSRVTALLGISLPIFWSGLMLQLVFYKHLSWFPYGGRLSSGVDAPPAMTGLYVIDSLLALRGAVFVDALWHLVMPGLAMSGITIAVLSRMTRASMLEVLRREYIRVARAKGLPERRVIYRHALRNAALPIVTVLGIQFGILLTGAVLTETVFSWPGIGRLAFKAIEALDYPVLMGFALLVTFLFSLINLAVDVCYGFLDPRIAAR